MTVGFVIELATRCMLVILFLPFSASDKIFNFSGAVGQARQVVASPFAATALLMMGLTVEIVMSLGVITGVADRLAAFILAGYCVVTALLWKQFWAAGDFWAGGKGRDLFWDFLKNLSLGGGFLLLAFGPTAATVGEFFAHPLGSSHPWGP